MIRAAVFALVLVSAGVVQCKVCSYQDVLDHVNLTMNNEALRLTRPVLDYNTPTLIELNIVLYSILALNEKTQTFVPFIWATMRWHNERLHWNPDEFCGISHIAVPRELLWEPDLFVYEMTDKDTSPRNPYLVVYYNGTVLLEEDLKVISTCNMDMHKFPFDTQQCNLTLGSAIHTADEMRLRASLNSSRGTEFTRELLQSQGEWEFLKLSVENFNFSFSSRQWETLCYTFTVKRRPLLHVINLLIPIMFFLVLDLASFFISDHRSEKLGFKVTVLLAISVLLLILNDILPSTSNDTPLIATYCIVIFAMMLLSVLETILVTFLLDQSQRNKKDQRDERDQRDHRDQRDQRDQDQDQAVSRDDRCVKMADSEDESAPTLELHSFSDRSCPSPSCSESQTLALILDEVRHLQRAVSVHVGPAHVHDSVWAKRINTMFFSLYVLVVALFLPCMYHQWVSC